MKVKTLIKKLEKLHEKHGNIPVKLDYDEDIGNVSTKTETKSFEKWEVLENGSHNNIGPVQKKMKYIILEEL